MASSIARRLRQNPTEAERRLWSRLRKRQLEGCRFRRQAPLGPYVVEFACLTARLVIEIDGGQHSWQAGKDAARTSWLEANGFHVLRFWNNEVHGNLEGVLDAVRRALQSRAAGCPPPRPSPASGEGGLFCASRLIECGTRVTSEPSRDELARSGVVPTTAPAPGGETTACLDPNSLRLCGGGVGWGLHRA